MRHSHIANVWGRVVRDIHFPECLGGGHALPQEQDAQAALQDGKGLPEPSGAAQSKREMMFDLYMACPPGDPALADRYFPN